MTMKCLIWPYGKMNKRVCEMLKDMKNVIWNVIWKVIWNIIWNYSTRFYGYYAHEIWGLGKYVKLVIWEDYKISLKGVNVYMLVTHQTLSDIIFVDICFRF